MKNNIQLHPRTLDSIGRQSPYCIRTSFSCNIIKKLTMLNSTTSDRSRLNNIILLELYFDSITSFNRTTSQIIWTRTVSQIVNAKLDSYKD